MNDYTDYTNCTEPECWHPDGHEYDTDDEFESANAFYLSQKGVL